MKANKFDAYTFELGKHERNVHNNVLFNIDNINTLLIVWSKRDMSMETNLK